MPTIFETARDLLGTHSDEWVRLRTPALRLAPGRGAGRLIGGRGDVQASLDLGHLQRVGHAAEIMRLLPARGILTFSSSGTVEHTNTGLTGGIELGATVVDSWPHYQDPRMTHLVERWPQEMEELYSQLGAGHQVGGFAGGLEDAGAEASLEVLDEEDPGANPQEKARALTQDWLLVLGLEEVEATESGLTSLYFMGEAADLSDERWDQVRLVRQSL